MILNYLLALACLPMYSAIGLDQVGKIRPAGKLPISNSVSNAAETATYTFGFITDHVVPEAGTLELTFPNQFEAGFLVAPVCNLGLCSVSDKKVTINLDFGLKKNTFYELIIDGVKNPPTVGGLGNFALQTFYGPSLLDSNLAFGVAGIENTVGTMLSAAVNVASNEEALAGKITKYEFKFKLNRILGA